jgi:signal transduction histidine kinase
VAGDASVEERLRASGARLLATADAERREIERSLHDGIQQDLIALAVKLQLVRQLEDAEPAARRELLDELDEEVQHTLDKVRALSDRIYPSVLAAGGLAAALRSLAAATGSSIRIEGERLRRYPLAIEETVYFCCRQALDGAAARGERPTLRIWQGDDEVRFEVARAGADLQHIRDRIETLGGRLTTDSDRDGGTRISASVPIR